MLMILKFLIELFFFVLIFHVLFLFFIYFFLLAFFLLLCRFIMQSNSFLSRLPDLKSKSLFLNFRFFFLSTSQLVLLFIQFERKKASLSKGLKKREYNCFRCLPSFDPPSLNPGTPRGEHVACTSDGYQYNFRGFPSASIRLNQKTSQETQRLSFFDFHVLIETFLFNSSLES